ncbi:oxygenase MpaB family protein [Amycolatopsis nigrescens]|uniref:oxygenase MpaB family protein n=1 Tax=Amycolatopsis nigrescens TaxID=381445 RepID=UPI00035C5D12|nr:oxygenase MpaB family protein [Amycolatopsis nigrescens]
MDAVREQEAVLDEAMVGAALLAGGANVIMQLARPGVGYGVAESRVHSGSLFRHPVKRTRTTLTYLAVATMGTDEEKKQYRLGVNKAHAQVYSRESSPVQYNAFDRDLQLWVAACLYRGVEDTFTAFVGPPDQETVDTLYRASATLGTTLQVPPERWPADRDAFEKYWNDALAEVSIDDAIRRYLYDLTMLRFLPRFLSVPLGPFNRFVTTGFLPPRFRAEMRLDWSPRQQRRFDRLTKVIAKLVQWQPRVLRQFPYNLCMWDLRRRIKAGRPLV